jgi:hypothetical protein
VTSSFNALQKEKTFAELLNGELKERLDESQERVKRLAEELQRHRDCSARRMREI